MHHLTESILSQQQQNLSVWSHLLYALIQIRVLNTQPAPVLSLTIVLTPLGVAQIHRIAAPIGPS
jgi:hypothetical protein